MSVTGTTEAAATFIKKYTHEQFIHPAKKPYQGVEIDNANPKVICDTHLSEKIIPLIGHLQFDYGKKGKASSHRSSNSSLNFPECISETDESDDQQWQDSSCEADEVDSADDKVPALVRPSYRPELSGSPKKSYMQDIDAKALGYLKGRGHMRRSSAPVTLILDVDIGEQDERASPVPPVSASKDEDDVPETPISVIESLKHEAAIRSQVKLRQMKRLDFRRGSLPVVPVAPVPKTGKPVSNERVHQIMRTFYGPQTKKQQQIQQHVGVLDPAEKASEIQIHPERRILSRIPPAESVAPPAPVSIPVPPPLPEILPSALQGTEQKTPEFKSPPVVEPVKPTLSEAVASLHPTVSVPATTNPATTIRRSSVSQDLEDTYKKMERNSVELTDSGNFTQSVDAGTSWFGGLIGFRPAPAPRKPGEGKPSNIKKKVKKRDLNAFAPAGF